MRGFERPASVLRLVLNGGPLRGAFPAGPPAGKVRRGFLQQLPGDHRREERGVGKLAVTQSPHSDGRRRPAKPTPGPVVAGGDSFTVTWKRDR